VHKYVEIAEILISGPPHTSQKSGFMLNENFRYRNGSFKSKTVDQASKLEYFFVIGPKGDQNMF